MKGTDLLLIAFSEVEEAATLPLVIKADADERAQRVTTANMEEES